MKIIGEMRHLRRAVDHKREALLSFVTTSRDKAAALTIIKAAMKRRDHLRAIVTDGQ